MDETLKQYVPVLANIIISLVSAFIGYKTSRYTIETNRNLNSENAKINAENAGKNRIIYEIERYVSPSNMGSIAEKLGTGNWTVLNSFSDPGNYSSIIIILGRIKL